jgi:Iron-dependent Transcriptional regulator
MRGDRAPNGHPQSVVEQVMPTMRTAGIVRSERGPAGGYRLNKQPEEITLERIVRLFQGQLAAIGCATRHNPRAVPDDDRMHPPGGVGGGQGRDERHASEERDRPSLPGWHPAREFGRERSHTMSCSRSSTIRARRRATGCERSSRSRQIAGDAPSACRTRASSSSPYPPRCSPRRRSCEVLCRTG